jgi:hypothetical protein
MASPTHPPAPPLDARAPRSWLARWLDRHAHPNSRNFPYLDLALPLILVPAVAGLLVLVVQLREANITARWEAYNRDDLARYAGEVVADHVALRAAPAASGDLLQLPGHSPTTPICRRR